MRQPPCESAVVSVPDALITQTNTKAVALIKRNILGLIALEVIGIMLPSIY